EDSSTEGPALEAAAALAAVAALVEGLKAFLSPYLSALLHLLFSPPVLACKQAGCRESASSIRIQLAGVIPPRLLLVPLFAHYDGAVKEGEAATVSLLAMAQRAMEQMDSATAAQHADACFTFLLKALDLRQKRPAHLPALDVIEQGSVAVLLALTMKLSEAKFKPLFLRLLDWASTPPAAQPDAKPLGRQVALFTAVLGLIERLRSVFVPYFRYLVDPIAAHLGGSAVEAEGHRRKKKKKSTAGMLDVADESSTEAGVVEDTWHLRFKVVQALHSCFLYDTVSFLDEARFHRLLPLLVVQLAAQPPTAVSALFGAQQTPSAAPGLGIDLFGDAVVSALVQMAVTANNDALWKSLNHQTLMATRSQRSVSKRLRAVAAVEGLVGRMREEYLLLLPETIPFVAELLEDPEHQVRVVTQRLIKTLEELSGESLEQYLQA
ncbi:MAG: U3snoRNP10 and NUC211 domain-containing protein, partial [Trebouxia sp. A1-2]